MEGGEEEEEGRRDSVEVPEVDEKGGKLDGLEWMLPLPSPCRARS